MVEISEKPRPYLSPNTHLHPKSNDFLWHLFQTKEDLLFVPIRVSFQPLQWNPLHSPALFRNRNNLSNLPEANAFRLIFDGCLD